MFFILQLLFPRQGDWRRCDCLRRIGEKFLAWPGQSQLLDKEIVLTFLSLYWYTETFPTSVYPYRQVSKFSPLVSSLKPFEQNAYSFCSLSSRNSSSVGSIVRTGPIGTWKYLLDSLPSRKNWEFYPGNGLKPLLILEKWCSTRSTQVVCPCAEIDNPASKFNNGYWLCWIGNIGGHFAAMEKTEELLEDVIKFVEIVKGRSQ